jgi:hypothetical protein
MDARLPAIRALLADCAAPPLALAARVLSPAAALALPRSAPAGVTRELLAAALFCVHSGRTLALVGAPRELFDSLSRLLLFRWENDCRVFAEPQPLPVLLRCSLALVPACDAGNGVAVWNVVTHEIRGAACPDGSALAKIPWERGDPAVGEIQVLNFLFRMRDALARFAALYLEGMPRMQHELPRLMEMAGLAEADAPIFRFFMLASASPRRRPIPLEN